MSNNTSREILRALFKIAKNDYFAIQLIYSDSLDQGLQNDVRLLAYLFIYLLSIYLLIYLFRIPRTFTKCSEDSIQLSDEVKLKWIKSKKEITIVHNKLKNINYPYINRGENQRLVNFCGEASHD